MNLNEKIKAQGGRAFVRDRAEDKSSETRFAVCIQNDDDGLLISMKIYEVSVSVTGYFGVTDEAGERAVYPSDFFLLLDIPPQNLNVLRNVLQLHR